MWSVIPSAGMQSPPQSTQTLFFVWQNFELSDNRVSWGCNNVAPEKFLKENIQDYVHFQH